MSGQIPTKTQINDHVVCDDTSRTLTPPRALDRSRIACDLERVEVLLKLNGAAVADRPAVKSTRSVESKGKLDTLTPEWIQYRRGSPHRVRRRQPQAGHPERQRRHDPCPQ